jgi:hypothetical protein
MLPRADHLADQAFCVFPLLRIRKHIAGGIAQFRQIYTAGLRDTGQADRSHQNSYKNLLKKHLFSLDRNHAFLETDNIVNETLVLLICSPNCP